MWSGPSKQKQLEESLNKAYSEGIMEALDQFKYNFVITDPFLMDHPIVYASESFLKMTGYSRGEVLGRNGRFLQGPDTDRRSVLEIREAIRREKSCQVSILNYKKDGTSFCNFFHLAPVFSKDEGRVIHFIGVQTPIQKCSRLCTATDVENDIRKQHEPSASANINANASNHLIYFGSCRRELCREFSGDLGHIRLHNSFTEDDHKGRVVKHACDAKESDKQKALAAITCVMSELAHFSKYIGKSVSDTRCDSADLARVSPISSSSLTIALSRIQQSFVLVDPHLPDMPIVHASNSFLQLTGYSRDEVLGNNCRILQGQHTNQEDISKIRQSIETEQPCTVRILNYRKDGNPFWNLLHTAPVRNASGKITEPLVRVLRLVDSEKPSMGYVYEAMDKAKEAISAFLVNDASRFQYIWDMVDRRWNTQLHKPLHGAGIYLNPKFFYGDNFDPLNGEINSGLHKAINRLVPDKEIRTKIFRVELQDYKKAQGYLFSSPECKESRTSLAPDLWWEDYGGNTPNLQKVAIKILSQPASSSGCERNWSTFEQIHSKKRNRLTHERLNDLVFVHYNLRLRHRNIEGTSNDAIELDEIEASDVWASWLRDVPNEPQDFDFTFEEYQRMEEQAIAMGEEAERVAMEAEEAQGDALVAGPSHRGANLEDDIHDDEPLITTRSRVAKERLRKAKHG